MRYICRDDNGGNGQPSMHGFRLFFCSSPGILRQPLHLARERETFWYLFRLCTPYGSRVSLIGEEEERRRGRKKMKIFDFFKIRLLSFCTAELKSEDIFVLRSFQWIFILLAKPTNHMPFHPCLLYCQNNSTTLIPT